MKIFKELKKLGYKHYTEHTVEELDDLPLNSEERIMEQALVLRWFREKYGLHKHICYFNDTNVWHGDLYKLANGGLMNAPMELTGYKTYEEAELACLNKLIEIVKNNNGK